MKSTSETQNFLSELNAFAKAAQRLQMAWSEIDETVVSEKYPFYESFDDLCYSINDWLIEQTRILNSVPMFSIDNGEPTTLKEIIKANIENVDDAPEEMDTFLHEIEVIKNLKVGEYRLTGHCASIKIQRIS